MKLIRNDVYFTSDTHYNHAGICSATTEWEDKRGTREFSSLDEMNQTIVDNINKTVPEDAVLFHLGDWSFGGFDAIAKFREQIKCKDIRLIYGNHDHHIKKNKHGIQALFTSTAQYDEVVIKNPYFGKLDLSQVSIVLMHYPIASWNNLSDRWLHLHGHVHSTIVGPGKTMDVGIDGHPEFRPYHLWNEIVPNLRVKPVTSILQEQDHHIPQ